MTPYSGKRSEGTLLPRGAAIHGQAAGGEGNLVGQRDVPSAGEDFVAAAGLVPLGGRRGLVHFLDDLPPAHTRVGGSEGQLSHLRRVRDDAHLGAAEGLAGDVPGAQATGQDDPAV